MIQQFEIMSNLGIRNCFLKTSEFQALKASSFSRFDWHFADLEIADW